MKMGPRQLLVSVPLVVCAAIACGGASKNDLFGPSADGGAVIGADGGDPVEGGGTSDVAVDAPPFPSGCPRALPRDGDPCSRPGQLCSYGESPIAECRTVFSCSASRTLTRATGLTCPSPSGCPASPQSDLQCNTQGAICPYTDGTLCTCFSPCAGGNQRWRCTSPSTRPVGCPTVIPNMGEPCTLNDATVCNYAMGGKPPTGSNCIAGRAAQCNSGTWAWVATTN